MNKRVTVPAADRVVLASDNNPPDPFTAHEANIADLFEEAKGWLDGKPIENQGQADGVQTLLRMMQEAAQAADASRAEEKRPHDEAAAAVQAKYAALIGDTKAGKGKAVLAVAACKTALGKWLIKVDAEQRAEAERVRKAAEDAAKAVQDAATAARASGDLSAMQEIEALVTDAQAANKAASRAEAAKPAASGYGRAVGLRSVWTPTLMDGVIAARHYWQTRRPECEAFFTTLAEKDVREGKRQVPGFDVIETKVPV